MNQSFTFLKFKGLFDECTDNEHVIEDISGTVEKLYKARENEIYRVKLFHIRICGIVTKD